MSSLKSSAAALAAATLLPALGHAAEATPTPDVAGREAATGVSELVVTATRSPQPIDQIGQSVTVIDAAQIRASQAVVVSDLLARTPGVSFVRSGGVGEQTSVRIRGAEPGQTVVVIDGVKLNDPTGPDSSYNFANLLAGDVARIELLRGAQSTLWGSQAIGGVINIVTAEPTTAFEGEASLEGGSMGTAYGRVAAGGAVERLVWRLAASQFTTDGISAFAGGREADGYRNTGASGRARVILSPGASLDLRAVWSRGRNDFDGFPPPLFAFADTPEYGTTEDLTAYAGLNFDLMEGRLKNRAAYGVAQTDRRNVDPNQAVTTTTFDAHGETRTWEYQGIFQLTEAWAATFGASRDEARMRTASPNAFDPHPAATRAHAATDSLYAQAHGELAPGLALTAGLRRDRHDTFGDHSLGQAAVAWTLNNGATVLRASFGQGFKAPSLFQLFSQFGNRGLKPETADAWDAGLEQKLADGKARLQATWFSRDTDNQIDFVSCFGVSSPLCNVGGGRFGFYDNIVRSRTHGVELTGQGHVAGLDLDANYTWTDAENASPGDANRGRRLARRPEHQADLTISRAWPHAVTTAVAIRYVGDSFDNPANTVRLKAYVVTDLRAAWAMNEMVELYGRVENLGDARYQTVRNYGQPGRAGYLGVRARF